ncbi:hypothetical protein BLAT2472_90292 [Burkholderia latens]
MTIGRRSDAFAGALAAVFARSRTVAAIRFQPRAEWGRGRGNPVASPLPECPVDAYLVVYKSIF